MVRTLAEEAPALLSLPGKARLARSDAQQRAWSASPIRDRLRVSKEFRHRLAGMGESIVAAMPAQSARTVSDSLAAEMLPLLAASKFLERNAERILAPRRLGRRGLPLWLWGVDSEVRRVAYGRVLVIGPSNYPLLLPGVQALQALAAGNAVVWKPGQGGAAVAHLFADAMAAAGLPPELLRITDDSEEAGRAAVAEGADKIFFTGSLEGGRAVLRAAADTVTPCVMELSGCDAAIVLPSADLERVVAALAFGMRLNGSATCMAPRRVLLMDADAARKETFLRLLLGRLSGIDGVPLPDPVRGRLLDLIEEARACGAHLHGEVDHDQQPLVLSEVRPEMHVAQADLFAPVLSVINVAGQGELEAAMAACPFGLTAAVFGEEREALAVAQGLCVGSVLVNDLMAPTADPRAPFGGRRWSGFGVTRGAEGLLEMTAAKVVTVRRGKKVRHFDPPIAAHEMLFKGAIAAGHAQGWRDRLIGVRQMISGAMESKRAGR